MKYSSYYQPSILLTFSSLSSASKLWIWIKLFVMTYQLFCLLASKRAIWTRLWVHFCVLSWPPFFAKLCCHFKFSVEMVVQHISRMKMNINFLWMCLHIWKLPLSVSYISIEISKFSWVQIWKPITVPHPPAI